MPLAAPFPWPGNKARIAPEIVRRLCARGKPAQYVEPFAGGLAVLLAMPTDCYRLCGDTDGIIVNIWRSIRQSPEEVARWADRQVSGAEVVAAHAVCVRREEGLLGRLAGDLEACDPVAAGLRLFLAGALVDWKDAPVNQDTAGIYTTAEHRSSPSRRPSACVLGDLSELLRNCKLIHGDWTQAVSPAALHVAGGRSPSSVAILLDPPYSAGSVSYRHCKSGETAATVAQAAAQWAREHPDYRVALCGLRGEHEMPGWDELHWSRAGKGSNLEETVWFSPGCGFAGQRRLF